MHPIVTFYLIFNNAFQFHLNFAKLNLFLLPLYLSSGNQNYAPILRLDFKIFTLFQIVNQIVQIIQNLAYLALSLNTGFININYILSFIGDFEEEDYLLVIDGEFGWEGKFICFTDRPELQTIRAAS